MWYDALFVYLSKGVYPSDYGTNPKRILRRKVGDFGIDNGIKHIRSYTCS